MNRTERSYFLSLNEFVQACHEYGAYGMTISGAGPSLFVAVKQGEENEVGEKIGELSFLTINVLPSNHLVTGAIVIK